jgi:hypothetical protein
LRGGLSNHLFDDVLDNFLCWFFGDVLDNFLCWFFGEVLDNFLFGSFLDHRNDFVLIDLCDDLLVNIGGISFSGLFGYDR